MRMMSPPATGWSESGKDDVGVKAAAAFGLELGAPRGLSRRKRAAAGRGSSSSNQGSMFTMVGKS
jgi:hypothetical protein